MVPGNPTYVFTVIDRSGSMSDIASDAEGGFNQFVADQRALDGQCYLSLAEFDHEYTEVYVNRSLDEVPHYRIQPRGMTALLDAIGRGITTLAGRIAVLPPDQQPGHVVFIVVTDGHENSSTEYSIARVRALVEEKTAEGWQFMFLAAAPDAFTVGQSYGFTRTNTSSMARGSFGQTYSVVGQSVSRQRAAASRGLGADDVAAAAAFTDDERAAMGGDAGHDTGTGGD